MKIFFLLPIIFCIANIISAQVDTTSLQKNLEDILEDATTDKEDSEYFDLIEYLLQNKIPINTASINELMRIPNVDRQTATTIIRYRNLLGGLNSEEQLRAIEGVNSELIDQIIPYLQFGDVKQISFFDSVNQFFEPINISFRSRMIKDIQQDKAFLDGKYYGTDLKIYNRLTITKDKNIRLGILTEKDPGEKSLTDFTTFHLFARNLGSVTNLVIGDFLFEFGQGLALWSRYAPSKGIETVKILPRNAKGIIPYLSSDENLFLRGVAAQINLGYFSFNTFYSIRDLDGSINSAINKITSLRLDGLHRDSSEVSHRRIINEKLFGINIDYTLGDTGNFGILFSSSKYGNEFEKSSFLDPNGNHFEYFSGSFNFTIGKMNLSGETAYNKISIATINNLEFTIGKNFILLFSYRNYPIDYWSLHSNGFGEKDGTQNESGFYSGLKLETSFGNFHFYYDQFKYPWTSDIYPFPLKGNEFLIYYTVKPITNTEFRLRYSNQIKEAVSVVNNQYGIINDRRQNLRTELYYKISRYVQMRSRLEFVNVTALNQSEENGFLIFQDLKYDPSATLSFTGRIVLFRTDSYNSRVYEFENDLIGVMSNPPLYGEGMRWYIVASYKTQFGLNLSMKYSELIKPSEKTMGSGDTLINSNIDNRLSFQLDFQL